jgi:regulatory protein
MEKASLSQRVRIAAERLLTYRPRSHQELLDRLNHRFPKEIVAEVVDQLQFVGLVDDPAFAMRWVASRAHRPSGRTKLVNELLAKGITRETAEKAVIDLDEENGALRAAIKAVRGVSYTDYTKFHRRLGQHLHRRGFQTDTIRRTLSKIWEDHFLDTPHNEM